MSAEEEVSEIRKAPVHVYKVAALHEVALDH